MSNKPTIKVSKTDKQLKKESRQAKLATLADKKAKGKLVLEDLDKKLDIIMEMLTEAAK